MAIKILQTTENQVMTVLQTRDGHIDIMGDLLTEGNELPVRFTDKIGRLFFQHGQISELVFGAEGIHMLLHHTQQLGGGRSKQSFKTFQFGINF